MITYILLLAFLVLLPFTPVWAKYRDENTAWTWKLTHLPLWAFVYGQIILDETQIRFTLPWHWELKDHGV